MERTAPPGTMSEKYPVCYAVIRMSATGRKLTRMCAETVTIRGIPSDMVIFKNAQKFSDNLPMSQEKGRIV